MKCQTGYYLIFSLLISFGAACSAAPVATNTNSNVTTVSNSNLANAITNTVATPTASVPPTVTTAGSPSAVVAAYYQSMIRKDEKGFRQVLSKATLNEFSADANAEGEKTLVGYWTGYSSPPKQAYETRNERISGDVALLEIKNANTGEWSLTKMVRENGEWKLDFTSSTLESLRKQQSK